MKFRKKPVVIEAVLVDEVLRAAAHDWPTLAPWIIDMYDKGGIVFGTDTVHITTLEGTMQGDRGDWIIQGVKGELYPCKPDIFAATYEPVVDHYTSPDEAREIAKEKSA